MRKDQVGRAPWLLSLFVLATPMMILAIGHGKKKPVKEVVVEEQQESSEVASIINHVIASENLYSVKLMGFSPRIETYVQYYQPDNELGDVATNDDTFLGRLKFEGDGKEVSFVPTATPDWFRRHTPNPTRVIGSKPHLQLDGFAMEALMVDGHNFDRKHYTFDPVRWEYLGDVRCLLIDIHPRQNEETGAFQGRIWVEDHDFAVVRMNGTRIRPSKGSFYVHFDCWRENLQPGEWLPVYVYSQETDLGKDLRYKSETRLWGYDLNAHHTQQEWTTIQVDAPAPIRDSSEHNADLSPVESARQLNMEAEQNVLDRLERARLIAPAGSVDKVLATVVNNLRVTNKDVAHGDAQGVDLPVSSTKARAGAGEVGSARPFDDASARWPTCALTETPLRWAFATTCFTRWRYSSRAKPSFSTMTALKPRSMASSIWSRLFDSLRRRAAGTRAFSRLKPRPA